MKVVVTGGSGQLGSVVLERLVAQRKIQQIISLDLVPPRVPSPRIVFRIADMRDPGLERHLEGADALVHLAFIVMKYAPKETMRAVNVEGTKRIVEAAAQHGLRRIVYASSIAAYGIVPGHPNPIVETTPRRPTEFLTYADNKYEVEAFFDAFEAAHPDIDVVRLRPGVLFGRRISEAGDDFLRRRVLPVSGSARGPIVWDEDVADAVVLALTRDVRGAFNLAASDPLSAEEFARLAGFRVVRIPKTVASAAANVSSRFSRLVRKPSLDPSWLGASDFEMTVSAEKAKAELGWKPVYPTSADVAIAFGRHARMRTDPRIALFLSMLPSLSRRARDSGQRDGQPIDKRTIHLDITGRRGGDYSLRIEDGVITLDRGIPRPPDSVVALSAETFLDLLAAKIDPATAHMVGKVTVRGEPTARFLIEGMVNGFLSATRAGGIAGKVARRLHKWFETGIGA